MAGFTDPIVGGTVLRIPAIQSPNFVSGSSGWQIAIDGSAEFNNLTIRGTFNGTNFVINTSGAFFYNGAPGSGNLIASIAPAAGTDAFSNHYVQGIGVYNFAAAVFSQLVNGLFMTGNIVAGTPDTANAGAIGAGLAGVLATLFAQSPLAGALIDPILMVLKSGAASQPSGSATAPHVQFVDNAGNSAVDGLLSGAWIKTANNGGAFTFQSPGMATGYTNSTMKYRLDAMDQVKWVGQFTQTTGVVGAGAATVINAVPAAYRPKTNWIAPCAWLSSGNTAKGAGILIFKTDGTVALEWPATTANGDQFGLSVSLPLDNIS